MILDVENNGSIIGLLDITRCMKDVMNRLEKADKVAHILASALDNIHDDIKALRLDPSSVAIQINNHDENGSSPIRIIEISSCNRCSACNQFLYDEEIMNGWSPDDSELHTICVHCGVKTMPNLTIHIRVREAK